MYAQVIIDIAHAKVDHVFSYQVPEDMEIAPGDRVLVPFGKGNTPKGWASGCAIPWAHGKQPCDCRRVFAAERDLTQ